MSAQRAGRSAEQEQFAASLHDMLAAADVPGAARQWAAGDRSGGLALWRKLAGAGVTALAGPIYAGTNEIQRTVIAERLLGLPR